jgi:hypothetical protein
MLQYAGLRGLYLHLEASNNFPPPPVICLQDWHDMICDEMRGSVPLRRWPCRCGIELTAGRDEVGMGCQCQEVDRGCQGLRAGNGMGNGRLNGFITVLSPQLLHHLDRFHGVFPMMAGRVFFETF